MSEAPVEHGPRLAFYSNLPGPKQNAIIDCLCGWSAGARSWEEVGAYFDEHIAEAVNK